MLRILTICLFALSVRSETERGECPDVTPFEELEVVPYLGRWYEERRINMIWEGAQDCNMAIYSDLGDGVVEVHNTGRTSDGYFTDIYGTAEVIAPGILEVSFSGYPEANYTVLSTDYGNYSTVITCNQEGIYRSLYAWVLAREVPLSDEVLNEALMSFEENGVDLDLFTSTYQGEGCPYYAP